MKKLTIWALLATFVVAGAAFAAPAKIAPNASNFTVGQPSTDDNDDSCDIGTYPAATLLLPYFEVDTAGGGLGDTTLFAITNVSALPQIAHVTIWTDWSYPVLDFNIFLTGYDVQTINLYDIIQRGRIAPDNGTSSDTEPGELSYDNDANPLINISNCSRLASRIPDSLLADIKAALTTGKYASGCGSTSIGSAQADGMARGYVTVDVSRSCSTYLPIDTDYYTNAAGIGFDNVFVGDYQQVDPTNNFAQGGPMVHIRAIPEGGTATDLYPPPYGDAGLDTPIVNFDRTFYGRYAGTTGDRRQPLPATFAARWINGGSTDFVTSFKIWREGTTGGGASSAAPACSTYKNNSLLAITEFVLFDEEENPETFTPGEIISPAPTTAVVLPETSRKFVDNESVFPPIGTGDVAGWLYLNLDNSSSTPETASQNWVIVSMEAEGRYSVDFDAAALGNGCTPHIGTTGDIGPAPNDNTDY